MQARFIKPLTLAIVLTLSTSSAHSAIDKNTLDATLSPCQDFFGYVNNITIKANPIPADHTSWGTFEQLDERSLITQHEMLDNLAQHVTKPAVGSIEQKLGDFYFTGMDEEKIEKDSYTPIKEDLKKIDALKSANDILSLIHTYATRGQSFLFGFEAESDFKNSSQVIAYATQGGLGLPERNYYLKDDADSKKLREAYVAHIQRMLELIGIPEKNASQQAKTVMEIETRLAKVSLSRLELRDPAKSYNVVSIAEADKITPHIFWKNFIDAQNIHGINSFSLSHPKFFTELDKMLTNVPVAQWQAYLRFHLTNRAAPELSSAFVNQHFAFYGKTLRGQKELKPRWKRVLESVNEEMAMALGELYVAKNFSPEAKSRALELVNNLRAALKTRIEKLDWMSAETKKQALEKWTTFMPKIGYPDEWRNWSGLNIGRDSYYANIRAADQFNYAWQMTKVGKPVDRKEWGMPPQMVNAYYNPLHNEIVFPAAILQPPFFDANADDALNYGAIGTIIGHEMTHGYDDNGSQFDAQGNMKNWWSDEDKKNFETRTGQLVKQFDNYVAIDNLHVNGKLTLGENIADLGGISTSYDALHTALSKKPQGPIDGLSQEQRFFISFARVWARQFRTEELKLRLNTDVHAPAMFRAVAAPSNMPAFAQAFSCKAGDMMVRGEDQQVKIW